MLEFRNNEEAEINKIYDPPEKIKFDREMVYKRYSDMRFMHVTPGSEFRETLWDRYMKSYMAWRPNRDADDWQSNITPPFTTTLVERALAEIVDQTIRPVVIPRGPEDEAKAKLMNHIMDYTWDVANGDLELYNSIKQALIMGTTIWQEYYWRDKREVEIMKKLDFESGKEEFEKKEIFDYDDIYGETVSVYDFFVDPDARTINQGRYKANDCIRRYIMNFDTFQETFKDSVWDQFGAVDLVKAGGDTNYYQFYRPPTGTDKKDLVEVLFYWGRRPDKFIIIANDIVIRDNPNPFNHKQLPFVRGVDVPVPNEFWGRGEPALVDSIQHELTVLRRMRLDRQHLDIFKMFLASNRETFDEDEAIVAPSKLLYVDDPKNSIVPLEYGDINPSAYLEEDRLRQEGREVTGIQAPQPASTATEAAIFKEATTQSLRLKIWLLSRQLLGGIAALRVANIAQFYSVPRVERIVGDKRIQEFRKIRTSDVALEEGRDGGLVEKKAKGDHFFEIRPDMITPMYGGFDLKFVGEPTLPVSRPLQQQRMNELLQNPIVAAAIENGIYDLGSVADLLVEAHEHDPDKLKAQPEAQAGREPLDQEKLLELANQENEALLQGQPIPGTPFANRAHTEIHLAFMDSEEFIRTAGADREVMANFVKHVKEEEAAQEQRGQATPSNRLPTRAASRSAGAGAMASEAKAAMPGRMIGPEGVPGQ